jgi:hypothetical protein
VRLARKNYAIAQAASSLRARKIARNIKTHTLAEAQESIIPEDIEMSGFHVRKQHTGEDFLSVFFDSP